MLVGEAGAAALPAGGSIALVSRAHRTYPRPQRLVLARGAVARAADRARGRARPLARWWRASARRATRTRRGELTRTLALLGENQRADLLPRCHARRRHLRVRRDASPRRRGCALPARPRRARRARLDRERPLRSSAQQFAVRHRARRPVRCSPPASPTAPSATATAPIGRATSSAASARRSSSRCSTHAASTHPPIRSAARAASPSRRIASGCRSIRSSCTTRASRTDFFQTQERSYGAEFRTARAGHRRARNAGGRDPRRIRARPGRARARRLAVLRQPRAAPVMPAAATRRRTRRMWCDRAECSSPRAARDRRRTNHRDCRLERCRRVEAVRARVPDARAFDSAEALLAEGDVDAVDRRRAVGAARRPRRRGAEPVASISTSRSPSRRPPRMRDACSTHGVGLDASEWWDTTTVAIHSTSPPPRSCAAATSVAHSPSERSSRRVRRRRRRRRANRTRRRTATRTSGGGALLRPRVPSHRPDPLPLRR